MVRFCLTNHTTILKYVYGFINMYISAIWNIKKRGSGKYLFCLSFTRIYSRIHGAQILLAVLRVVMLFIEYLSVFLDMVNIKHNIEL